MPFDGLLPLPAWGYVGAALLLTHITVAAVTIFLHRNQAHRALTLHPAVTHFFRFWLWLTTGTVTREWVAVHRKHHATCETDDDPHSPQIKGIKTVLFGGLWLYREEAGKPETVRDFGKGTPDDWLERNVYARHTWLGLTLMLVTDVLLFGLPGLLIFAVQLLWIPFWAAGVVNGVGHYWGYRNFETPDASRNFSPIGLIVGGEELHNNHHAYRHSARFSNKWWEFDIGWLYIRALERLNLADVKRTAPKTRYLPEKSVIDVDTVKAVVRNRFHVLKLYGAEVVKPALRMERVGTSAGVRRRLRRLRRLMTREGITLTLEERQSLANALQASKTLQTVQEFKERLKVLLQPSEGDAAIVQRLQQWCAQAEATGIEVLGDFAAHLRGYSMRTA